MKKRDEIIFGIALIMLGIIFFVSRCAEADNIYDVRGFQGGLNKAYDGTNLRPDQAWELSNLVFKPNALEARQGYSYWNDSLFHGATTEDVNGIYYYNDKLVASVGYYFYISPTIADPGAIEWDTTRLHWHGDSLIVYNGDDTTYDIGTHEYAYMKISWRDSIDLDGTMYCLDYVDYDNDTTWDLTSNYVGNSTDTVFTYTVYKRTRGFTSMTECNNLLYICIGGTSLNFPIVYNDTTFKYLAVLDTGVISNIISPDTNLFINRGRARLEWNGRIAVASTSTDWSDVQVNDLFFYTYNLTFPNGNILERHWDSNVISIDTAGNRDVIELDPPFDDNYISHGSATRIIEYSPCEIRRNYYVNVIGSDTTSYRAVEDTNKVYTDFEYGDQLFTGLYAVSSDSGYKNNPRIYINDDTTFIIDGVLNDDDQYYIMTHLPIDYFRSDVTYDSLFKEFPRFNQIFIYRGQLYAIGAYMGIEPTDPFGGTYPNPFQGDYQYVAKYDNLFYSRTGYLSYIHPFNRIPLGVNEAATVLFTLRSFLYIGTNQGIWVSSDEAGVDNVSNKVLTGNNIPDIDNWAKSTEEYGYFVNRTGGYRFDGIRAEEFAFWVTPTIKDNYASDIIMAYQDKRLYISFPDSNFTLVYDERYDAFTTFDFGMTCIYAPPDTDIIYFGHSEYPGRVYYYPNGEYWDRNSPTDSSAIDIVYESGHQSLTEGPWNSKKLMTGYFPVQSDTSFHVDIFSDFSTTASDTFTSAIYGSRVHRIDNLSAVGDYFKTKITATIIDTMIIRPYRLTWQEADMKEGD